MSYRGLIGKKVDQMQWTGGFILLYTNKNLLTFTYHNHVEFTFNCDVICNVKVHELEQSFNIMADMMSLLARMWFKNDDMSILGGQCQENIN